jgi:hypothetical protein
MSQGESFWHTVILESRGEDFGHAILGQADADLELLHVAWVF